MNIHRSRNKDSEKEVQVINGSIRSGINLDGLELLKLDFRQPGANVMCTTGTLWLTQQGDPDDHLLEAGQSFTLDQRGTVLVQGLPCGQSRHKGFSREDGPTLMMLPAGGLYG